MHGTIARTRERAGRRKRRGALAGGEAARHVSFAIRSNLRLAAAPRIQPPLSGDRGRVAPGRRSQRHDRRRLRRRNTCGRNEGFDHDRSRDRSTSFRGVWSAVIPRETWHTAQACGSGGPQLRALQGGRHGQPIAVRSEQDPRFASGSRQFFCQRPHHPRDGRHARTRLGACASPAGPTLVSIKRLGARAAGLHIETRTFVHALPEPQTAADARAQLRQLHARAVSKNPDLVSDPQ